jgi:tetratricopeptide (TPR) repeat protein/predicted Ser/Thr protein kinase
MFVLVLVLVRVLAIGSAARLHAPTTASTRSCRTPRLSHEARVRIDGVVSGDDETAPPNGEADTVADRPSRRDLSRAPIVRGTALGRYLVLDKLGEGGMGVVYQAYDPELHRRVALKLLHAEGGSSDGSAGRARLLREAQAIARLSHPNVVHVYDVGTVGDHVYIALEYIDGEHLGRWLKCEKRSWRDVLDVFRAAGRGLAAAHAAGLVHRDFKPDNVLVGKDGRVLVTDFGLARADEEAHLPTPRSTPPTPLDTPLTEFGTVMGTPGYAAPEHLRGIPGNALSDQFSFAASLWAGLYGARPYRVGNWSEYREALAGGLPEPPANSKVPAWLRRAVERGLAQDAKTRYPTMDMFLEALAHDPAQRQRRVMIAAGLVVLAGAAIGTTVVATRRAAADREQLCTGAEQQLAGVWDTAKRDSMQRAFVASNKPFAAAAFERTAAKLDERAHAWTAMHTEACQATRLRGDQPESVLTLRMACLDDRKRELGQLVDVLAAADAPVVERAVQAASALSPLDDCANVTRLLATDAPPADPAKRAKLDELRTSFDRAKVLGDAGKYKDAVALAKQASDGAHTLGYGPFIADSLELLGEEQSYVGDSKTSAETLRAAVRAADASRHDAVRAKAYAWLVAVVGYDLEKGDEGIAIAKDARGALDRIGGDPRTEAMLESSLGRAYSSMHDYPNMLEHHKKALALRRRIFGEDDPMTANSHNNVAIALDDADQIEDSLAEHRLALAIRQKVLGPDHPQVAQSLGGVGSALHELGDLDGSIRSNEAAIAIARRTLPPHHVQLIAFLANQGQNMGEAGRIDEAQRIYDEALPILRSDFAKSARLPRVLCRHAAHVLVAQHKLDAALLEADEAVALAAKLSAGKPNDDDALVLWARGVVLAASGKYDAAATDFQHAIDLYEKTFGRDTFDALDPLTDLARLELARGHAKAAVALAERALTICDHLHLRGFWLARTQQLLADAKR